MLKAQVSEVWSRRRETELKLGNFLNKTLAINSSAACTDGGTAERRDQTDYAIGTIVMLSLEIKNRFI